MLTDIIYTLTVQMNDYSARVVACAYEERHIRELLKKEIANIEAMGINPEQGTWTDRTTGKHINLCQEITSDTLENLDITINGGNNKITVSVNKSHIFDSESASRKWHFGAEQEFPESKWGNIVGIIEDSLGHSLFFAVGTNEDGDWENCKIFSSIDLNEDSFLVSYPWNDKNDNLLLEALNNASEKEEDIDYETVLRSIEFEKE